MRLQSSDTSMKEKRKANEWECEGDGSNRGLISCDAFISRNKNNAQSTS